MNNPGQRILAQDHTFLYKIMYDRIIGSDLIRQDHTNSMQDLVRFRMSILKPPNRMKSYRRFLT